MADASDRDDIPGQRKVPGFGKPLSHDRDGHLGPLGAPHLFDTVHEGQILSRFSVDLDDLIGRQEYPP